MLMSSLSWEHGNSKVQEHLVSCILFILSHVSYWFQWEVTTVLTVGHSLYWRRISSGLWIEIIHTGLSPFHLLSSITLSHVLADGDCLEWMKLIHNFFIHRFSTFCQNLCRFLRFDQKLIRRLSDTTLLCIRTEIFSRHTNAHIRKNSGWNLILVCIRRRVCMWSSDFRVCWEYLFSIFTISYWTCLHFCIMHTEVSFQFFLAL